MCGVVVLRTFALAPVSLRLWARGRRGASVSVLRSTHDAVSCQGWPFCALRVPSGFAPMQSVVSRWFVEPSGMITGLANQRQAGHHVSPAADRLSIGLWWVQTCFVSWDKLLYLAKSGSQTCWELQFLCGYNKQSILSRLGMSLELVCTGLFLAKPGPNRLRQLDLAKYSVINAGARRRPWWIL